MAFPDFFDTCTLFGQVLNDLILSMAEQSCFAPYWSREVLDAVERNVVQAGRGDPGAMRRRIQAMEREFPEAMVEGYERLIATMTNHPGDRHVLAACVKSPAQTLVTFNVRDFDAESLAPYEIEVLYPDNFLLDQLDLHPIWSSQAINSLLRTNLRPPQDIPALARALAAAGVPNTAAVVARLV